MTSDKYTPTDEPMTTEELEEFSEINRMFTELTRCTLAELEAKYRALGYIVVRKPGPSLSIKSRLGKYLGPNGEEWSGKGRKPKWVRAIINQGHDIEGYWAGEEIVIGALRASIP